MVKAWKKSHGGKTSGSLPSKRPVFRSLSYRDRRRPQGIIPGMSGIVCITATARCTWAHLSRSMLCQQLTGHPRLQMVVHCSDSRQIDPDLRTDRFCEQLERAFHEERLCCSISLLFKTFYVNGFIILHRQARSRSHSMRVSHHYGFSVCCSCCAVRLARHRLVSFRQNAKGPHKLEPPRLTRCSASETASASSDAM
jgi:hypothetical protein